MEEKSGLNSTSEMTKAVWVVFIQFFSIIWVLDVLELILKPNTVRWQTEPLDFIGYIIATVVLASFVTAVLTIWPSEVLKTHKMLTSYFSGEGRWCLKWGSLIVAMLLDLVILVVVAFSLPRAEFASLIAPIQLALVFLIPLWIYGNGTYFVIPAIRWVARRFKLLFKRVKSLP